VARLLVASRNRKKLAELHRVLEGAGITGLELLTLDDVPPYDEAPEAGATFEENAIAKARDGYAATGLPTLADDSGIAVDALNGMPGVLSARWAGGYGDSDSDIANYRLLLAQLGDVPDQRRGAAFVSVCALMDGSQDVVVRGEWPGVIAREPLGEGGFGYDPVFIPEGETQGDGRSAAQLSPAEKDAASHRGRALRLLVPALRELAGGRIEPGRRGRRSVESSEGLPIVGKVEGAALTDDDVRRLRDDLQR
jgi:XTP/dITP diphosphohydrolase